MIEFLLNAHTTHLYVLGALIDRAFGRTDTKYGGKWMHERLHPVERLDIAPGFREAKAVAWNRPRRRCSQFGSLADLNALAAQESDYVLARDRKSREYVIRALWKHRVLAGSVDLHHAVVAELSGQVIQLRAELAALRAGLATEVRTRRLVVLDATGREAIYTTELPQSISLEVTWHSSDYTDEARATIQADCETTAAQGLFGVSVGETHVARLAGNIGDWPTGQWPQRNAWGEINLNHSVQSRRNGEIVDDDQRYIVLDPSGLTSRTSHLHVVAKAPMRAPDPRAGSRNRQRIG